MSGRGGGVAWGLRGEVRVGLATTMRRGLARRDRVDRADRLDTGTWCAGGAGVNDASMSLARFERIGLRRSTRVTL